MRWSRRISRTPGRRVAVDYSIGSLFERALGLQQSASARFSKWEQCNSSSRSLTQRRIGLVLVRKARRGTWAAVEGWVVDECQ